MSLMIQFGQSVDSNWHELIDIAVNLVNNSEDQNSKFTPSLLFHRRSTNIFSNDEKKFIADEDWNTIKKIVKYNDELAKERENRYFDKFAIDRKFEIDDRVLIYREKLEPLKFNWDGPFKVIENIGNNTYRIEDGNGKRTQAYGGNLYPYNAKFDQREIEAELRYKGLVEKDGKIEEEDIVEEDIEIEASTKRTKQLESKNKTQKKKTEKPKNPKKKQQENIYKKNFKTKSSTIQSKEEKEKTKQFYKQQGKALN